MTTSCPVSILPIEILGHIFTFLPNCHQDFPKPNPKPPSWLAVTHVCRRWRFASLSYIDLWTNIITDPVGWTEESLRRSGSAPIAIKIKLEPISSPIPNAISQALSHYPHAGRIDLEGKGIWPLLACVPVKPAPFLYSVALKERAPQFHLKHDLSFLHEDLPNLIGLLLDGIQLPWSSSGKIFKPTLVELSLSLGGVPPDHRPSDMEVREVLLSLPVLEHLFLAHAFRESTDTAQTVSDIAATPDYPYPRLSFPHLTHLTIISDSAPALSFFACSLQIPKAKAMTVAYMPHTLSGNSINNVIPHSTHFLSLGVMVLLTEGTPFMKDGKPAVTQPGIRVHGASPGHSIYFTFRSPDATDEDGYEDNFADGEVPFLQVCIDTRIPAPEIGPTSHCEIARSLVLDILAMAQRVGWHPDRITIDSVLFRHSDMLRSAFSPIAWSRNRSKLALSSPYTQQAQHRSAPDLALSCRRLSVGGDAVRGLLTTLKSKTTLSNVNGEPKADLLFPTLPRLDIQGVDFVENDGKLFELLRGTLVRRSLDVLLVNASPLVQVFVRRCNVTKEQIEKARKASPHIQKLWWDGRKKGLKKSGAEV